MTRTLFENSKSDRGWFATRLWCELNPGKTAAIVTPFGTFTLVYTVKPDLPRGTYLGAVDAV